MAQKDNDGQVETPRTVDLATGKQYDFNSDSNIINYFHTISSDRRTLVTVQKPEIINIWKLRTSKKIRTFNGTIQAITPDVKTLVTTRQTKNLYGDYENDYKILKIWNIDTGKEVYTLNNYSEVSSVYISPDGKKLVTGGKDGTIKIWQLEK